jgi:hypothetical protein
MYATISDENRSSYVSTDEGRILAAGLSRKTAQKFAAVNSLIRLAQSIVDDPFVSSDSIMRAKERAKAALIRAGVLVEIDGNGDTFYGGETL